MRVHKVQPSLSQPWKSVVRLTDSLDIAMAVNWDFKPKKSQIVPGVSHIYIVWSRIHQNAGAAVVKWINSSPCKPGDTGSISGFTSLSDETLSCGHVFL